ncbi:NUDIX hydrolase [Salibacterium sp. K-3]
MIKVDVAYGLICEQGKVLMVNNKGGGWSLPGGAVEKGETLEQAVIREVREETGLTVEIEHIVSTNEVFFKEKGHHALYITFKAKIINGSPSIQYEDEIEEIKWMDYQTANKLMPYNPSGIEGLLESFVPYIFQG